MKTFVCAGDRGDILGSLPAVRALGGGVYYFQAIHWTRERLTPDKWFGLDRILKAQPYIADVLEWRGENTTYNMNDWRARLEHALRCGVGKDKSLVDWHLEQFALPLNAKDEQWLTIPPRRVARVVFNRTGPGRPPRHVYHNLRFPWHLIWKKYQHDAVFVGLPEEYEMFRATCGEVPHEKTADLYEAAQVIAGCDLFVGNQSAPFWIAEGLKKRILLEVWPHGPNCLVPREGVVHGWNEKTELPDLIPFDPNSEYKRLYG